MFGDAIGEVGRSVLRSSSDDNDPQGDNTSLEKRGTPQLLVCLENIVQGVERSRERHQAGGLGGR